MIVTLAGLLLSAAIATPLDAIRSNNEGVKLMEKKESYQAYQKFIDGLSKAPFDPVLHLNLGLSFELNEEFDKALKEYDGVAKDERVHPDLRFKASFNAARVKAHLKDIPGALIRYQAALNINPESNEAKTNIELLWNGQGGGKGEGKDNQDNKDQQDQKQNQDQQQKDEKKQGDQKQPPQQKKPQPQKFESKELTQQDVQKILDELKNQEQRVRAEYDKKNTREVPREKNW